MYGFLKICILGLQDPPERPRNMRHYNSDEMMSEKEINIQRWRMRGEECPEGTIPIRRTREEDVLRASSVSRFGTKTRRGVRRDTNSYGHEVYLSIYIYNK